MSLLQRMTRVMAALLAVAPSLVYAVAAAQVAPCEMVCCQPQVAGVKEKPSTCCSSSATNQMLTSLDRDNCGCQMESAPTPHQGACRTALSPTQPSFELDVTVDQASILGCSWVAVATTPIRPGNHDPHPLRFENTDSGRAPPFVK